VSQLSGGAAASLESAAWEHVYSGGVADERAAEVRRQVVAELLELARRHAAEHAERYQKAVEQGQEDMAQRAYASQNAWMEVARVLRVGWLD